MIRGLAAAGALTVAGSVRAAITSGMLLTNFMTVTFALPSGTGVDHTDPGVSMINIPNAASAWVLVTDSPQMCIAGWKTFLSDGNGTPLSAPAGRYPGDLLCFQIGFSNCGSFTGWSVHITDVLPANVVKAASQPGSMWVSGGYQTIQTPWATSLGGPWYTYSNTGLVAPLYMRWLLGRVGMHKTGYVRYCVTVL